MCATAYPELESPQPCPCCRKSLSGAWKDCVHTSSVSEPHAAEPDLFCSASSLFPVCLLQAGHAQYEVALLGPWSPYLEVHDLVPQTFLRRYRGDSGTPSAEASCTLGHSLTVALSLGRHLVWRASCTPGSVPSPSCARVLNANLGFGVCGATL